MIDDFAARLTILTCSLENTDPIFSHDSLQADIPGSAVSIGWPGGDLTRQ